MDLYLRDGEMGRTIKEKNHFKEDLKSLKRDYVALKKASKSQRLGQLLVKWRIKITTFEKALQQ